MSNNLLAKYNLRIPWIVNFSGHPDHVISTEWESKAKEKREGYDENPHEIEIRLAERGIIEPPLLNPSCR